MERDPRGKKTGKRGWGRTIFLLALVVECILIGCLIWGKSEPSRALPRRLSAEEAERYESYSMPVQRKGEEQGGANDSRQYSGEGIHGGGMPKMEVFMAPRCRKVIIGICLFRAAGGPLIPSGNYANHKSLY